MAISVDRVYQTVLAVANKEQRGYITPQEFNLFANQAQNEIFESYYYDLNRYLKIPGNKTVTSDPRDIIEEKISIFRVVNQPVEQQLSSSYYKIETVKLKEISTNRYYTAEEVTKREYDLYHQSPLTTPKVNRPLFYMAENYIYYSPSDLYNEIRLDYIRRPHAPNWTYIVVNDKALSNPDTSVGYRDFELHASEEKNLVVKILQYAGISIKDVSLSQLAGQKEVSYIQQEKS
jgi:hypothetical protein|tara:strand:+ start:1278 stop:1976 length:699 start_codon:yes stop_codon:yes gene_type:complete